MPSFDAQLARLIADTLHVPLRFATGLSDGLQAGIIAAVIGGVYLVKTKGSLRAAWNDQRIASPQSGELLWPASPPEALRHAARALAALGTVSTETAADVTGSVRFGVVSTQVTVTATPAPEGTLLSLRATGGDGLGRASRSALARLKDTIHNLDQPGFIPNREGISPAVHVLQVVALGTLLFGTIWLLQLFHVINPSH